MLTEQAFAAFSYRVGTDQASDGLSNFQAQDPASGFGGQWGDYQDDETWTERLGRRDYDPGGGLFLTRDPSGYAGGVNLYDYARHDTPNLIDPTGLCPGGPPRDGWNTAADFFGGFGHIASFGLTDWINSQTGANSVVNTDSGAYAAGGYTGMAVQALATEGAGAEAADGERIFFSGPGNQLAAPIKRMLIPQQEALAIRKIENAIRDHAQPMDIQGAVLDATEAGVRKSSGELYNHTDEVQNTLRSLRNNSELLNGQTSVLTR